MHKLKLACSMFAVLAIICLVGYSSLPSLQNWKSNPQERLSQEAYKNYNQNYLNGAVSAFHQAQNHFTQINLNEALSIQTLPDGRCVALMPVQGGAAWFVIGQPLMAQTETPVGPSNVKR